MFSLCFGNALLAQTPIPGDSIVHGPMLSPVYNNKVRVWVLTKNNTGSAAALSVSLTANGTPATPLSGTVFNSDDRLGYSLRSFEYTNLAPGETYTANVLINGTLSGRTATVKNEDAIIDDFEFLAGGCGRIYDLSRCIDQPESAYHINGDPQMFNVMAGEGSDMMIWLGDAVYLLGLEHAMGQCPDGVDDWANKDMAFDRYRFFRNYHDQLVRSMPQLAITDNHDTGPNEFNKTMPTLGEMREIFKDWWPNPEYLSTAEGPGLFSSYRYKDVEYFLLDNRSYRDGTLAHLGPDQMEWLKQTLLGSTATFKILINGTPSFERNCGGRNFCATTQSTELINWIRDNNINGVLSLSADIHEQKFMIREGDVKYPLYDVLSGNLNSDVGTGNGNYNINYGSDYVLTGVKQTYLRVNVYGPEDDRRLKVEYAGLDGQPYFEEIIHQDMLTSQNADAFKLGLEIDNALADGSAYNHTVNASGHAFAPDRNNTANGALHLTAASDVQVPMANALSLHDRPFSLTFWMKPDQLPAGGSALFSNATANTGFTIGLNGNGKFTFTDHATQSILTSQYSVLAGDWSYVVYKYDNVRRKLDLYYNGFLIQSWNSVAAPAASSANLRIGSNFEGKKFIGSLDKINLYGRLISDENIVEAADIESSRGEVLKMTGAQNMAIPGSVINNVLANNFTIEFWGKLNADPGTNFKILASNGRVNNNSTGISFEFPDSNKLNVVVGNNTSGWNTISEQGPVWNVGEWNHIALSVTENGPMVYYVNGQPVATGTFGSYIPNDWGLGFGKSPYYTGSANAELDDMRIWQRALTADEISAHLHHTLEGNEPDLAMYYDFSASGENATSITGLGSVPHEVTLDGGTLWAATSPVAEIDAAHRAPVTGKWSKANTMANSGLSFPDNITNYSSNVVVGKDSATETETVPADAEKTYLKGGWKVDPVNLPFATVRINLQQTLADQFDAVTSAAGEYFLLRQEGGSDAITTVAEGNFDGQNATFYDVNLTEGIYYLAWSAGDFTPGRGGALSLTGGHQAQIPYAQLNPILASNFTVEFWVAVTQDPANNDKLISNHGKINGNSTGFALEMPTNNSVTAAFGTNTSTWNSINSGASLIVGEWNHIAVTAAPGDAIKLYVNGELKASNPYTAYVANTNWDFALGTSLNYGGQTFSMMDEFRIWDKAKTQAEIKAQMHDKVNAQDEHLAYNFTFDQENDGQLLNSGTLENTIPYTNAQIIDATSPVAEPIAEFADQTTGNWSIANAVDNGLYAKDEITSFTQNLIVAHQNENGILALANVEDTSYVTGGWHLNALNMPTADLEADLQTVLGPDFNQVNAAAQQYLLLKGDPASDYEVVATAQAQDGKVLFEDVALDLGNYYLAFESDLNAVIAQQGGAIELDGGHEVYIPKEGVNAALANGFTIELWGRLTQAAGQNTKLVGFSSYGDGSFRGWEMEFLGNQTLQTITGGNGGWNTLNSSQAWTVDEWNHAAVTYVPNGEFKFYLNGELADSMPVGDFIPNIYNLALGKNIANNAPTNSEIDEFRIWNTAKTAEQIKRDMYLTITEPTANLVYNYTFNQDDSGFLVNSGSENIEVQYSNAGIIPATAPVRNVETVFRNAVAGNWSVKNDNANGLYLTDDILDFENNVVIGKQADGDILHVLNQIENDTLYLNSSWKMHALFMENASPRIDVSKVFENLNDVNLIATEYYLMKGDPATDIQVVATGTKEGNIVSFPQIALTSEPLFLAWKNEGEYPVGTFPVAAQSIWKYNDSGLDLGTDWKNNGYDDSAWEFGNAILGYGDGNQATTLDFGPDDQDKYRTYYLRHTFNVENAAQYGSLLFNVLRDDGVIVYVNGTEAFRMNMPEGAVDYNTFASSTVGAADETTFFPFETANLLQDGENVIAVELHQSTANSSDLSFDMEVDFELQPAQPGQYPIAKDSEWKYLDNGTDLGATTWNQPSYDNSGWQAGNAPLGYGDAVNTVISYGPDASDKYITSYFTRDIEVNTADMADMVEFGIKRDDAAVVYVNGVEAFRENLPAGAVSYLTTSSTIIDGVNENRYYTHYVPKTAFANGVNRIAVEVHNRDGQSSDLKFDMYVKDFVDLSVDCTQDHVSCFTSIAPTAQTPNLLVPNEHRFQLLFKQGDTYMTGSGNVPGNHDFTGYVPVAGSSTLGYLSVNHENNPGGVSMLDIHLDPAQSLWAIDDSQAVDFYNTDLVTTNRNCSGGITPWGTVVTAEEATEAGDANSDGYQDVGWLVEIDPATAQVAEYGNGIQEKLWAMGRMNHENVVVKNDGAAAYYGEDGGTHCVYKFVPTTPGDLYSGTVYVLKLDLGLSDDEPNSSTATWIPVPNATQADRNNLSTVAGTLGGTNFNGVEDCEISPIDGKIYFTSKGKNRIYSFKDDGMTASEFETFAGGMSYPIATASGTVTESWADGNDNLTFDDKGNLWVCQDGGLNYIWVIRPNHKQDIPEIKLFASMPAGAEPTGLTFSPDFKYGFFSVQHPAGGNTPQPDATFGNVTFNASASVVFSLKEFLGVQAPVADFVADQVVVNEGETVAFTDLSTNSPNVWQWTFEGGTPATSTEENPVVMYTEAGTYNVTLTAANAAGNSQEMTKVDYIIVEEELGVHNPLHDQLNVYPNPTDGNVTIDVAENTSEEVTVSVFDLLGRTIPFTSERSANRIQLNIKAMQNDQAFFIRIKVGEKTANYKMLKK